MLDEKKKISEIIIKYPDNSMEPADIYIPIDQVDQLPERLNNLSSQIAAAAIYWTVIDDE